MSDNFGHLVHSTIWEEEAQPEDPFHADACFCRGYDVYGDLLGKAKYLDYLYLLFRGEPPSASDRDALELLAVALANPGPRDQSVHAAMAAGVGGSTSASALIAALAVGAGSNGGAREVFIAMQGWQRNGTDIEAWRMALSSPQQLARMQVWPESEHPPGFAPYAKRCAKPVLQTLDALAQTLPSGCLAWLQQRRADLESVSGCPLGMAAVTAAALTDLGFSPEAGEMLTLLLRLPGAAAHALEQSQQGFRRFPFFELDLENDPGPAQSTGA